LPWKSPSKNSPIASPSSAPVKAKIDRLAGEYQKSAKLPEFRPGKAPLPVVARKYKEEIAGEAVKAIRTGHLAKFGQLMSESHEGSRTLFENSCEEPGFLAAEARNIAGCWGRI